MKKKTYIQPILEVILTDSEELMEALPNASGGDLERGDEEDPNAFSKQNSGGFFLDDDDFDNPPGTTNFEDM